MKQTKAVSIRLDNTSANPFAGYDVSPTIRQGAGPNGTANVAVVIYYDEDDYKGPNKQYVEQGKLIACVKQ